MLGDRALRVRQPHPLVFLVAADVDPAQPLVDSRRGTGLLGLLARTGAPVDRLGRVLRARAVLLRSRAAHTRPGNEARWEEGRGGREGRYRRSREHLKKKWAYSAESCD